MRNIAVGISVSSLLILAGFGGASAIDQYQKHKARNQIEAHCQGYGDAAEEIATAWPGMTKAEDFKALFDQVLSGHPTIPEETVYLMFKFVYQVNGKKSVAQIRGVVQSACLKSFSHGVEV